MNKMTKAALLMTFTTLALNAGLAQAASTKPVISDSRSSTHGNNSALLGMFAFNSGSITAGGEYESMKDDTTGMGGYFLYSGKDDKSVKNTQTISFGGSLKAHLYPGYWDISFAPGFGVSMVDAVDAAGNKTTKTVFGPSFRTAALYRLGPKFSMGLESFLFTNWFDKDVSYQANYTNVVFRIDM